MKAADVENDRRKPWDGQERRGCYFDPIVAAQTIAAHLDTYQAEREQRENDERYARIGRAVVRRAVYLIGAACVYAIGRKHQEVAEFLGFVIKG
jgi:hypothetical protein